MRMKTFLCATMLTLPVGMAQGQDVQDAISDSVADRLSPGNGTFPPTENGLSGSVGDAVRSGVGTATNEVLRGNSIGGAIQQGTDQAIRRGAANATGQLAPGAYQNGTYQGGTYQGRPVYPNNRVYSNGQPVIGQTLYRDSSGRFFRQDSAGNRYYTQSSPATSGSSSMTANSRPRLGVGIEENDQGVQITQVTDGSAAAKAGLQSGDVVISANGQEIRSTDQLAQIVRDADANADLDMKVMRNGEEQTLTASLASQQSDRYSSAKPSMNGSDSMSARLQALEQEVEQLKSTIQKMRDGESDMQSSEQSQKSMNQNGQTGNNSGNNQSEQTEAAAEGSLNAEAGNASADASLDTETSLDDTLNN